MSNRGVAFLCFTFYLCTEAKCAFVLPGFTGGFVSSAVSDCKRLLGSPSRSFPLPADMNKQFFFRIVIKFLSMITMFLAFMSMFIKVLPVSSAEMEQSQFI